MNAQEALETIKYEVDEECHCGYIEDELRLAMTALEKQIPKKVIPKGKYHFSCPLCKNELGIAREDISVYDMTPPNFCENCGQALDWSDIK